MNNDKPKEITLRQWYAGQAMAAILSNQTSGFFSSRRTLFESVFEATKKGGSTTKRTFIEIAYTAFEFADSMIEVEAREKGKE